MQIWGGANPDNNPENCLLYLAGRAGVDRDDGRGDDHAEKSDSNQKFVHKDLSWVNSNEPSYT
jgi:hypothetical protein